MNASQKKIWQLLTELSDLCNKYNIKWFLSGRTAIRAYLGAPLYRGFLDFQITVDAKDVFRLDQAIKDEKVPNRYLEYVGNNSHFRTFCLRYIDTTTTLYHFNDGNTVNHKGIFIEIQILRHIPKDTVNYEKMHGMEKLWENTSYHFTSESIKGKTVFRLKRFLGRNIFAKRIFRRWLSAVTCDSDYVEVHKSYDGYHIFPQEIFQNLEVVFYKERILYLPNNTEFYFTTLFGKEWKTYRDDIILEGDQANMIVEGANNLVSAFIPYKELSLPWKMSQRAIARKRRKNAEKNANNRLLSESSQKAWLLAQRSGDRYYLRDVYEVKMPLIKNLYDAREFLALEHIFETYDSLVRKYVDLGYGMAYDEFLFKVYLEILEVTGQIDFKEHIEELVTPELLSPLPVDERGLRRESI